METTWSDGLSRRLKKKKGTDRDNMSKTFSSNMSRSASGSNLPQIRSQGNSPAGSPQQKMSRSESAPPGTAPAGGVRQQGTPKKISSRTAAFLDRQTAHSSVQARKNLSVLQRQIVKDGKAADDVEFWGSKGVEGFRVYLRKKFGSIVAGWRHLDADKNGRLSFYEFCNACRAMGYHGNLKKLWRQLDYNANGFVSLMEIDSEVGTMVGTFKLTLIKKYGDILTAWKKSLDKNGTGRVEEAELAECLADIGLSMDAKKLFGMLRSGPQGLGVTLAEFDPEAHKRFVTGDLKGLNSGAKASQEFIEDLPEGERDISMPDLDNPGHSRGGGARQFRQELKAAERAEVEMARNEITKLKCGLHTVKGFKEALIKRCGSVLGAWREALDLDGNGRLTFGEFTKALHILGFHGDIKGLWKQLDSRGQGILLFSDLDKDTDDALQELRTVFTRVHGNMLMAWLKGIDTHGNNCVTMEQFERACRICGFSRDAKRLFQVMQPEAGRKFLTLKDFDTKAYLALSRGDFRMLSESEGTDKRPLDMTFDERMRAGFFFQIRKAWDAAQRDEFAKACRMANTPDHLIDSSEEFETLLKRKYGSLINAWRNCLDADGNGKLTFIEFCTVVRNLGYGGDLKQLWKSYDKDDKGCINLRDLDHEAYEHVTSFLKLLSDRYGDLDNAWKAGFNKDPHDSIDETQLKEACDALSYPLDAHRLFKCLQPMPGRQLITIWDLDPEASRKRAQGKETHLHNNISLPKSPTTKTGKRPSFGEFAPLDDEGHAINTSQMSQTAMNTSTTSWRSASRVDSPESSSIMVNKTTPLKILRQALRKRHRSTVAAWCNAFDPDMTGRCGFSKFMIVLEDCGYHGNSKTLWADISEKDFLTFKDLDAGTARVLDEYREFLVSTSGSILQAWHTLLDTEGAERVDEFEFITKMSGHVKNPKMVFKLLLNRHGQRSIAQEDMEALLITVPVPERAAIWSGASTDERAMSSLQEAAPEMVRCHTATDGEPSPRSHVQRMYKDHHAQDKVIRSVDGFKNMLSRKYGSLFAGFRKGLDVDQNGVVTQRDFASACQRLGVKVVKALWTELDVNQNGQISLLELDPETSEGFNWLETVLIEKYGTAKDGWKKVFDYDSSLRCDKEKFVDRCKALEYTGDAERLFKLLCPEPGRVHLSYDDLWLNLNPNDYKNVKEPSCTQGSPRSQRSPHGGTSRSPNRQQQSQTLLPSTSEEGE